MKQLTKKAYTRKAIIIGSIAFSLIALTATGLAAFVLSASSESTPQGGLHVGIVDTKAIKINVDDAGGDGAMPKDDKYIIDFDPKKDDNSGRIRWDNQNYERLSNTVTGNIDPASVLSTSKVTAKLTMGSYDSSTATWTDNEAMMTNFKNAASGEKQYIVLPDCFDNEVELTTNNDNYKLTYRSEKDICDFSITFSFNWGSFFNGMNPGNYYDDDEEGKAISDKQMQEDMAAFQKALFGEREAEADLAISYKLTIKVDTTSSNVKTNTD